MTVQKAPYTTRLWEYALGQQLWLAVCLWLILLALSRLVYEGLFPQMLWLGRPEIVLPMAGITAVVGGWLGQKRVGREQLWQLWPLLLNVILLIPADVDLVRSGFLLGASVWLVGVLWWRERPWWLAAWLALGALPVYLLTMSRTVGAADTFEFQVTAPIMGVVHPTGYPLYLILGKLWTLLPLGSVAWRLNVGTAVYGIGAAVGLLWLVRLLLQRERQVVANVVAVVTAALLALRPTFWSQAIAAEVYTLHNLIVALVLIFIIYPLVARDISPNHYVYLAALLGLGLTNHLTTIILLPAAVFSFLFTLAQSPNPNPQTPILKAIPAFFLPLLLYAYLPLRWQAVNHEPMGWTRFVGWVTGDQFQDALQLMAWWRDPTRYEVVARLFVTEWGWWGLAVGAVGLAYLWWHNWRIGALLSLTWFGFTFYCLNYYVPDLNVFLLPAHLVTAAWMGVGIGWATKVVGSKVDVSIPVAVLSVVLVAAVSTWHRVDQSQNDGLTRWGMAVLHQPLAENAVILADSEKIAPLLYLQRAEGWRPDLDIKVLPDEAAYHAELTNQIERGRTVYLGRFVPGLEGVYHLRSAGPLTEVSTGPLTTIPEVDITNSISFGEIDLVGIKIEAEAAVNPQQTAVTFHWQASRPVSNVLYVYVRWDGEKPVLATGQHPANNYYPTVAWEAGEIVPDFHLLPHPYPARAAAELQVALAPPFTPANELPWQTVAVVDQESFATPPQVGQAVRVVGEAAYMAGVSLPAQARPQSGAIEVTAVGQGLEQLEFGLVEPDMWDEAALTTELPNGQYTVAVRPQRGTLSCGWGQLQKPLCPLGTLEISGVPIPEGATNYGDKIALLEVIVPETELRPGGVFNVNLQWQVLAPMSDDYTVFVQLLNEQDKIVGQVDAWPLQGTYPTSAWQAGEIINDPYAVQLDPALPAGNYRLIVGFYRLADFQRLPVLNADGAPLDDKYVLSGLVVQ